MDVGAVSGGDGLIPSGGLRLTGMLSPHRPVGIHAAHQLATNGGRITPCPATIMMRLTLPLLASMALLALPTSPLPGQSDPRTPPPITWCERPVPKAKWKRQAVSLQLAIQPGDTSEAQRRLEPYLPFLLSGIAERYAAEHQPTRDLTVAKTRTLPPGEPRYSPADLTAWMVTFDLKGDGTLDSIAADTADLPLIADLKAAILAAAARGDVFGPYADPGIRTRLGLIPSLDDLSDPVGWPAFTLYTPINRPARAHPGNDVGGYPADALGWNGKLLFRYKVNEHGRAVPESAFVLGAEDIIWKSDRHRQAYETFKRQVEKALPTMRFSPAEVHGCYLTTWVQQEFVFSMHGY